jgi:hypothetical protein
MSSDPASRARTASVWRLAGLFLASVRRHPGQPALRPAEPGRVHVITAIGIVSGSSAR